MTAHLMHVLCGECKGVDEGTRQEARGAIAGSLRSTLKIIIGRGKRPAPAGGSHGGFGAREREPCGVLGDVEWVLLLGTRACVAVLLGGLGLRVARDLL